MRILWKTLLLFSLVVCSFCDCSMVERCSCLNTSNTLLCTASSCKTLFYPSTTYSYNHLVFTADQGCKPCPHTCRVCLSEVVCTSCEGEYYLSNGTCLACSAINCQFCEQATNGTESCLSCLTGYYLDPNTGLCEQCPIAGTFSCPSSSSISSCKPTYFLSNDGASCIQCDRNCQLCVSVSQCGTCSVGYYLSSYRCYKCSTGCLGCQSSAMCSSCSYGQYLDKAGVCLNCSNLFSGCSGCTSTACITCNTGFYPFNSTYCVSAATPAANCLSLSAAGICTLCQPSYYLSFSNQCLPYCSNLCTNCSGPHFGLCSACSENAVLFNMNCLPQHSISLGLAYQIFHTARNNLQQFSPLQTTYCLETIVGYSTRVQYGLNRLGGYSCSIKWKVYMLNIGNTITSFGYNLTVAGTSSYKEYYNTTQASNLCASQPSLEYVERSNYTLSKIAVNNTIAFSVVNSSSIVLGLSEILIVVKRCGGLYGTNCLVCSGFSNCTMCRNSSYYLNGADCVSECPSGYYTYSVTQTCYENCPVGSFNVNSNLTCTQCPHVCKSCTNLTVCLMCNVGYFLNSLNTMCVAACPDRYFGNSVLNTCDACVLPCLTCKSASQCLLCYFGFLQPKTLSCLSQCPAGSFGNLQNNMCESCNSSQYNCLTCLNSVQQCLSCQPNFYLLNFQCLFNCPIGYFNNETVCTTCSPQCKSCAVVFSNCTSCNYGYLFQGGCSSCPVGYFPNDYTSTCDKCSVGCVSCTNNGTFCQACIQGYLFVKLLSNCVTVCPVGYYATALQCAPCKLPCLECTSATTCVSCATLLFYNNTCIDPQLCPNGTYADFSTMTCLQCNPTNSPQGCATCSSLVLCLSCGPGYQVLNGNCLTSNHRVNVDCPPTYYNNLAGLCLSCVSPCQQCLSLSMCNTCRSGYLFVPSAKRCTVKCDIGYYLDSLNQCIQCPSQCTSCANATYCSACAFPNLLNPVSNNQQQCFATCPKGYYPSNLLCLQCEKPCSTCLDALRCLTCLPGNGLQYQYSCVPSCPTSTFNSNNQSCQLCVAPCSTCITISTNCTTCTTGLLLQNYTCVNSCTSGYFRNVFYESCSPCIQSCLECVNTESTCTKCRAGYLYNGECATTCPTGLYAISANKTCLTCQSPCFTCTNSTNCLSCISQYYLETDTNICVRTCRSMQYPQLALQLCLACVYPCRRCFDALNCLSCLNGAYYQNQCLESCPSGTYLYKNTTQLNLSVCVPCSSMCQICSNASYCLSCSNSSLFLYNGTCVLSCPILYFGSLSQGKCVPCMKLCASCLNDSSCESCLTGYLYEKQCIASCPLGFVGIKNLCDPCSAGCLTCITTPSTCLSCVAGKYLYIQQCVDKCPYGTFSFVSNQSCIPCKAPCESCSDAFSCDTCMYGFILYRGVEANQCVLGPHCPNSYYLNINSKECVALAQCPPDFLKQSTFRTCSSTCPDDFVAYYPNYTCISECPSGYWVDSNLVCQVLNSSTPVLPEMNCTAFTIRNLLTFICFLNVESQNLLELQASNISTSVDGQISIQKLSKQQLQFILFPNQQRVSQTIVNISFIKRYSLRGQQRIPLQRNPVASLVKLFDSYSSDSREIGIYMYQVSSSMSEGAIILWLVGLIRNRGVESVYLLDLFQRFFVVCFLNVQYPPNLGQFLEGFRFSVFSFLPTINRSLELDCMGKFFTVNRGVSFIQNFLPCVVVVLMFLSILGMLHLLNYAVGHLLRRSEKMPEVKQQQPNNDSLEPSQLDNPNELPQEDQQKVGESYRTFQKKLEYLIDRFNLDYAHDCLNVVALPLFLFGVAQCTFVRDQLAYFSTAIAFILTAGALVCIMVVTYRFSKQKWLEKLTFMVRGTHDDSTFGLYHLPIMYADKLLKSLLVVLAYYNPSFVLSTLILLSIVKLVMYFQQPFNIPIINVFYIVMEVLWMGLHVVLAVFLLYEQELDAKGKTLVGCGGCIIVVIMSILGVIYLSAQLLIFEWFEWQESKTTQPEEALKKLTDQEVQKNASSSRKATHTGRLARRIGQQVRDFFSRANIQPERSSQQSSELNVVKRNYLFEDSVKEDGDSSDKHGHILIECIKNTAAVREPHQSTSHHP